MLEETFEYRYDSDGRQFKLWCAFDSDGRPDVGLLFWAVEQHRAESEFAFRRSCVSWGILAAEGWTVCLVKINVERPQDDDEATSP